MPKEDEEKMKAEPLYDSTDKLFPDIREMAIRMIRENPKLMRIRGGLAELSEERMRRIQGQADRQKELLQGYIDAVKEVNSNKTLSNREKIIKLLKPLVAVNDIYFRKDSHKFIDEDEIDLNREIDTKNLIIDEQKYLIIGNSSLRELGLLNTQAQIIHLSDKFDWYLVYCRDVKPVSESEFEQLIKEGIIEIDFRDETKKEYDPKILKRLVPETTGKSVSQIYKDWLGTLNQDLIKSKDLLTQILVCYTIKRALNGDKEAIDKLYSLYEGKAITLAKSITATWGLAKHFSDIKGEAQELLRSILSGFSPAMIMETLINGKERAINIQKRIIEFYVWYYSKYAPDYIEEMLKWELAISQVFENYFPDISVMLSPFAPINSKTKWITAGGKRENRFNSYSFVPSKKTNLTTWLFGPPENPMWGRYRQLFGKFIKEYFRKEMEISSLARKIPRRRKEERRDRPVFDDGVLGEARIKLLENGVFRRSMVRNVEIVIEMLRGIPDSEIAEKYAISERQIYRICQRVKTIKITNC